MRKRRKCKIGSAASILFLLLGIVLFGNTSAFADVILDNGDSGTSYTGDWRVSGGASPYGSDSLYARPDATYRWELNGQPPGTYEVLMWWTITDSRGGNIPVEINTGTASYSVAVDQTQSGGQWNSLGTYDFSGTGNVTITASDALLPDGRTVSTCADAVWFKTISTSGIPVASIDSVFPNPAAVDEDVSFSGSGVDFDGTIVGYEWTSSIDGFLSNEAAFTTSALSSGVHVITLVVADNDANLSTPVTANLTVQDSVPESPNNITNPGFEDGTDSWRFYTNGAGNFNAASPGYQGALAARVDIGNGGSNIQFFQTDVPLEPDTEYELSFAGYSSTGHDLQITLCKHVSPYTNYGLSRYPVNLSTGWQVHTLTFTTENFSAPVDDARLSFWLASDAASGDVYWFDDVRLAKAGPPQDSDGDGIADGDDNCPGIVNGDQADGDSDNIGDACDVCPDDPANDIDSDGICGDVDNCPNTPNPDQADSDGDGMGDACDCPDADGDGVCDGDDNCPDTANVEQLDTDGDGIGDACDSCTDVDADEVCDDVDNCPDVFNPGQSDSDGNGIGDACEPSENDLANPGFEDGTDSWRFYTNGAGSFDVLSPGYEGTLAGRVTITSGGSNIQFFQTDVPLEPDTEYELSFAGYSNTGHDLQITLCKHVSPYTNYGLSRYPVNLTTGWQVYSLTFTTENFSTPVEDARLSFWLASDATSGDVYWFDDLRLRKAAPPQDSDGDGVADENDNCPGISNADQADRDADDIGDACDTCPDDAANDADSDGVCGDVDNCPNTPNPDQVDSDGDGMGDACDCPDADEDGVCDSDDNCPDIANPDQADTDNDNAGDACDSCPNDPADDIDSDGVCGDVDNCPADANSDQADGDGDGIGDACDACPNDPSNDVDGDGICGDVDNCPNVPNAAQSDTDGDGVGDACDCPDADSDGICDSDDNCPAAANPDQADSDDDGQGDLCDVCPNDAANDADSDGICGDVDNCPGVSNADQTDSDGNGIGDACEVSENSLSNPGFEDGTSPWRFYTNGTGSFDVTAPAYDGTAAARVRTITGGTNIQFFQPDVPLAPNTEYDLTFAGYSTTGHDLAITLCKHVSPYTNYGLSRYTVNLGTGWQIHTVTFTTENFSVPVDDARLSFWLADHATAGDEYWFDRVSLREATAGGDTLAANFSADMTTGAAPLTVQFTELCSGQVESYDWQFGDGATSTVANPSHQYTEVGTYDVSLTVSGSSDSDTKTVNGYIQVVDGMENIYVCDAFSGGIHTWPTVERALENMGGVETNGVWSYTNPSQGITYFIHEVVTPAGMRTALKEEGSHIVSTGHSNYGLGSMFVNDTEWRNQLVEDVYYVDDDRFCVFATDMYPTKVSGMKYSQAYPNWEPILQNLQNTIMPFDFSEGTPPYNYYITYQVPGDPTPYKVELSNGHYLERMPSSGVPAWDPANGPAPDPIDDPEYFVTNPKPYHAKCEFTGEWPFAYLGIDDIEWQYHEAGTGQNTATWTLAVPCAGTYRLEARWDSDPSWLQDNATNATYLVEHAGGTTTVVKNQRTPDVPGNDWNNLGTYDYDEGAYTVTLSDDANGRVVAWEMRLRRFDNPTKRVQADFRADVTSGAAPLKVKLFDMSISAAGFDETSIWEWDFGDGTQTVTRDSIQHTTHIYTTPGTYTITLRVKDEDGNWDTETKQGYVVVGSSPPVNAEFASTKRGDCGLEVYFKDLSHGNVLSREWDFGDGSSGFEENPVHFYEAPGQYQVSLTVVGPSGSDTRTNTVEVYVPEVETSNQDYYKTHFGSRTILDMTDATNRITPEDCKFSRMFLLHCTTGKYFVGTFHRGKIFFTSRSWRGGNTTSGYLRRYLLGYSDQEILEFLNGVEPIYEFYDFTKAPAP